MSGMVGLQHFDRGLITTLGAELVDVHEDGGNRSHWAIPIEGVIGPGRFKENVPVFFVVGNSPYTPKYYPCVVIRRIDLMPAFENGGSWFGIDYRKRAANAPTVTLTLKEGTDVEDIRTGFTKYETKERATPYNISYEIMLRARGDHAMFDSIKMHAEIQKVCMPPGFAMTLEDTVEDERGYDVIVTSVSPNLDALDLTERDSGWSIAIVVHGELDHQVPFDAVSVYTAPTVVVAQYDPDE